MPDYRIARFKPSYYEGIMATLGACRTEVVAPRYRAVIRKGRQRVRTMVELQVLPGTMFIPIEEVVLVNQMLELTPFTVRYVRNPADEWAYAVCSDLDIKPIQDWAESKNNEAEKKALVRVVQKRERKEPLPVGTRVSLRGGPFGGHHATVVVDTGFVSTVNVDGLRFPVNIPSCQICAA